MGANFGAAYGACAPFTMTSVERCYALWEAASYIACRGIGGDVVECGVWRGGSSMIAAFALKLAGDTSRDLYLFDTFSGMPAPSSFDVEATSGVSAASIPEYVNQQRDSDVFAYASQSEVERNMAATGYPAERCHFVAGMVEDTIPAAAPERIALLRLDTDWYESTRHELEHLWDRLVPGGVLIIDDYGHWQGARKAVDEFFAGRADSPLLARVDYTGRIAVKR
jgi:hypothetical protein